MEFVRAPGDGRLGWGIDIRMTIQPVQWSGGPAVRDSIRNLRFATADPGAAGIANPCRFRDPVTIKGFFDPISVRRSGTPLAFDNAE